MAGRAAGSRPCRTCRRGCCPTHSARSATTNLGGALGGHGGIGGLVGPNGLGGALGGQQKSGPGKQGGSSAPSTSGLPGATQNLLDYLLGDGGV